MINKIKVAVLATLIAIAGVFSASPASAAAANVKNTCWGTGGYIQALGGNGSWVRLYCGESRNTYRMNAPGPFRMRFSSGGEVCYNPTTNGWNVENRGVISAWRVSSC